MNGRGLNGSRPFFLDKGDDYARTDKQAARV